jgi:hypothetical protein
MNNRVVIDKDILGWGEEHKEKLLKHYVDVLMVGDSPNLTQRSFDREVASYCKNNNCDLLTGDRTAYDHYFEAGVTTVQITAYDWYKSGDRRIYLIRIVS